MSFFDDEELRTASPEVILRRTLSPNAPTSTHSALTQTLQHGQHDPSQQATPILGKGQCGTIHTLQDPSLVIKLPNSPTKIPELFSDFQTHNRIYTAFASSPTTINIPPPKAWITPSFTHFWLYPPFSHPPAQTPTYGLISTRIPPVPPMVRKALVAAFCPAPIREISDHFLRIPEHADCLIRLYLGRRCDNRLSKAQNCTLRNFPMHVDEMERVGLDTAHYARVMAGALAVMHWSAGVDAADVEFVLGGAPTISVRSGVEGVLDMNGLGMKYVTDFAHEGVGMWVLDFNECGRFEDTRDGVEKLVKGFWFNDPYYPRPGAGDVKDKELWNVFSSRYLEVSAEIGGGKVGPRMFVEGVEEEGRKRGSGSLFR
jgi:hypothetical protein